MTDSKEIKISPHFWLRRLHSLSGIFPIGAFLLEHMFSNSFITLGPAAYNNQIHFLQSLPYVLWLEVILIYIPILYHAFYGFYVMFTGKSNLAWYPYRANILYTLQRWTGIIAFIYIGYHAYHTRGVNLLYGTEVSYERMAQLMSDPKMFVFYLVGMAAVMFHFANGIWGFLISWGITVGPKAQKVSGWLCTFLGILLFVTGANALIHLVK
ncbi:MAG: succinate dehydrogenase [Candidatus Omnitrophica bacterium]|nr:succinate dehydrogenase [Candidatus Omnitrophota bacterium]